MRQLALLLAGLLLFTACSPVSSPDTAAITDDDIFYAPAFTLQGLDGETHTLDDYRGQWVILNFWQTTCVPCVDEMPVFDELAATYLELEVLAVNIREEPPTIREFLQEQNLDLTVLLSEDVVSAAYSVIALPQTVIIDPRGGIVWRQFGPVELDSFDERIRGYLVEA